MTFVPILPGEKSPFISAELCDPSLDDMFFELSEYQRDVDSNELDSIFSEITSGISAFENLNIISDYIGKYGIDTCITELIGNENLITTVKDKIVQFVKWIFEMLKKLASAILRVFKKDAGSSNVNIHRPQTVALAVTKNKASLNSVVYDLKRIKALKKTIEITTNLSKVDSAISKVNMSEFIASGLDRRLSDDIESIENTIRVIKEHEVYTCSRDVALDVWEKICDLLYVLRSSAIIYAEKLNKVVGRSLPSNMTSEQALTFFKSLHEVVYVHITNDKIPTEDVKKFFSLLRTYISKCLQCDSAWVPVSVDVVSQLAYIGEDAEERDKVMLSGTAPTDTAGVELRIAIPQWFQDKLSKHFGDKFKVKRLIISNARGSLTSFKNGLLGATFTGYTIFNVEVFVNYTMFANHFRIKELRDINITSASTPSAEKFAKEMKEDRIDEFVHTIVHECRHLWQGQKKKIFDTIVKPDPTLKERNPEKYHQMLDTYLNAKHELDAREKSNTFSITDKERDWVRTILEKCARLELQSMIKHR